MRQNEKQFIEPRTLGCMRWNACAVIWPTDHIEVPAFRKRLEFFALNASDKEILALADALQ